MPTPPEAAAAWQAVCGPPNAGLRNLVGRGDRWGSWAAGVCHMALGDYRRAFDSFNVLVADDDAADEAAGLAAAAIASGMRQLGDHVRAVRWDERATGCPGAARVDGLIGLVADCIGQGDTAGARTALQRAGAELAGWRDRVRYGWVATELALLVGDHRSALEEAEAAAAAADETGSVRHRLKSQLFLAVARRSTTARGAEEELHGVVNRAAPLQLRPLVWPAVVVLGPAATAAERAAAEESVAFIAGHRPPGVGAGWDGPQLIGPRRR